MSHPANDKKKNEFSFYRRKGAPNRTRFKEARLVAYASLQKFSKYTYYLGLEPKFLQNNYLVTFLCKKSLYNIAKIKKV